MASAIWAVSSCESYGTLSPETEYNTSEHSFSFYNNYMCDLVWCMCMCVNVFASVYGHRDQGRTAPPSLSLAPYSLETRSLSKPGAQPVTSEPQDPAVSTPNLDGNFRCVALLFVGLVWF